MPRDREPAPSLFNVAVDTEQWREIPSLTLAGPEDTVFAIDPSGRVVFGDGTHGRRPPAGAIVAVSYREGGGASGNVGVSITTPWPPAASRYLVATAGDSIRIAPAGRTTDVFHGQKRLNYFNGQLLSAEDFREEQQYLIHKRHLHNRLLHGWGVVRGLTVSVSGGTSGASVMVEPGVALDRYGRELVLASSIEVAIETPGDQFVTIEYTERETDPVPVPTDMATSISSRIEEGVSIGVRTQEPLGDGIALARIVADTGGWSTDGTFEPPRCR